MTWVYPLDHAHGLPADEVRRRIGGKAANLGVMARDLGLPVPPGFVISTAACRVVLAEGWPGDLDDQIRAAMAGVEARVGRRFGDPGEPLLVSVRSGAPVSMPGMMDTLLNVGLTPETEAGLAGFAGPAFAADCARRLAKMFRDIVGEDVPTSAWEQLRLAVAAVFDSWTSDRAVAYRAREGIADDLGTAVTVQAMVFGNRDARSATGVVFTRDPATGENELYGDVMFQAQGEDVVAGGHRPEPITALDLRLPAAAAELRSAARRLEGHLADMCDIEFTIELGRLWLLQVRAGKRSPQAALRLAVELAEDPDVPLTRAAAVRRVAALLGMPPRVAVVADPGVQPIATGLPASPGIATGAVATSSDAVERLAEAGAPAILVREETSPADVRGMALAAGILTARGGLASHAAVVARGWGIPAVVGADRVRILADGIEIDGRAIAAGEALTIDGGSGAVYAGTIRTAHEEPPEVATLLGWARELGIPVEAEATVRDGASAAAVPGPSPSSAGPITADDCLRCIAIKGMATTDSVAAALAAPADETERLLADLAERGLLVASAGAHRLTEAGRAEHRDLVAAERTAIGAASSVGLLDGFLRLDTLVKEAVTAWQLRTDLGGDAAAINDHSDAAYDAGVLDRLGELAAEADAFLAEIEPSAPRFGTYRRRLAAAAKNAIGSDARFVASPRVDSFHGVWFELHEDLILLAGRTREAEAAAGRA